MFNDIFKYSAKEHLKMMRRRKASFWVREENKTRLGLFKKVAKEIPAYKSFLKKKGITTSKIKTVRDLDSIPAINKSNYLRKYSLKTTCWKKSFTEPLIFTSTSGFTGAPYYFPRNHQIDYQASMIHELFLQNNKQSIKGPTFILDCFGMGVWIGGLITYQAFQSMEGYPISILTPGINKHEIFRALQEISPHSAQTILVGYAPFIKDVLDEAADHKINLKNLDLRLIFAAEPFTEKFRDYICKKAGITNPLLDTMNIYGSADMGAMSFESPLSILIRRLAMKKKNLFKEIFPGIDRTPTLTQYNPAFISFEEQGGEILLTGNSTLPLVKYTIGDHGGVIKYKEMIKKLEKHGINIKAEIRKAGISSYLYELPFVYVYERTDLSTTIYGLQIYPETIREALLEDPFNKFFTGKLTLVTKFNKKQDQYLEINLEARKGKKISKTMEKRVLNHIVAHLRMKNSEFHELYSFLGKRANPKIVSWKREHPLYFKTGIKQNWVLKNKK